MKRRRKPNTCRQCARDLRIINQLTQRLSALEEEVNGPSTEQMIEEFEAERLQRSARADAVQEFHRLQWDEFLDKVPWLGEVSQTRKAKYEAFMKERGFEP